MNADDWRECQNRFQAHLQRRGHAIYNLDFANPVPADDPTPLLETFKLFLSGQGVNPHTRQQAAAEKRERATQAVLNRLKGLRLKLFCKFIAPARKYALLREDGLADVGLGYPLPRQMLREVGRRFAKGGMIEKLDDIFWLTQNEVQQAVSRLDRGEALSRLTTIVPQRKATWRAARRVSPPLMLPQIKSLGVDLGELKKGRGRKGDTLKCVMREMQGRRIMIGVRSFKVLTAEQHSLAGGKGGTLARLYQAGYPVPDGFVILPMAFEGDQLQPGEILVAVTTNVGWTTLFPRAAAIVTDVGAPLSHAAIVARELGIPAVVGCGNATMRLKSGDRVRVDGGRGIIEILEKG